MLDVHSQTFLQVISTERIMSHQDVVKEAVAIFGENVAERQIQLINRKLDPLNLTIKSANCELTGKKYWVFTANVIDKVMNYPGKFTDVELEFVRKVFSEIINSEEGHVSNITCINVRSQMTGRMSLTEAQDMLKMMAKQQWVVDKDGEIYMGVRSIGELMPYFKDSYADGLTACPMCKDTIFYGYKCENCDAVSHFYCLARLARIQSNLKCMSCDAPVEQVQHLPENNDDDLMEVDEDEVAPARARRSKRRG